MMMKEAARPDKDGGENLISNLASGLCFDFSNLDPTIYLAGTESGMIYKCSCSYYDSYMQEFMGHEPGMPVYKIQWSPFAPNIFLSCSADWTVMLWKDDSSGGAAASKPLISFSSSNDYVADIQWAPSHSTVFGSVTGDGKLDIWDIEREMYGPISSPALALHSTLSFGGLSHPCSACSLNPAISLNSGRKRLSTLLFGQQSPVVVTGSSGKHESFLLDPGGGPPTF